MKITRILFFGSLLRAVIVLGIGLVVAARLFAQNTSPWENAVGVLQQAFTNTIARGLSLVAIVVSGLTFAFGEGGLKRVLAGVLFGVGMAIAAVKFNTRHFEIQDLIRARTLDQALANRLEDYVLSHKNILICGGTGSGKTTTLNILSKFIPDQERILLIEDTAEIHITQPNLVRFEARHAQYGLPGVAIRDLLKAALRHRPDRILLGEVRGGEAFDLLQLLNTGHSGTLSTIHANSAKQGLARFTSCTLQSGVELPYRAIKSNIADSLHVVIQIERRPGRRYISEVLEINSYDPDADLFDYCAIYQRPETHQRQPPKTKTKKTSPQLSTSERTFAPRTGSPSWCAVTAAAKPFNASRRRKESQSLRSRNGSSSRMKKSPATSTSA
jgi:type IV secretory pathway VirB2 component (pilin)/energy-coupling factor transporter ATP-binding protein EcfA2